jgi:hypothetical protein
VADNPIVVKLNNAMAAVACVLIASVAAVVIACVIKGILSEEALWALGAWVAGMIKGALIPAIYYRRKNEVPGVIFKVGNSPVPPPPEKKRVDPRREPD